MNVMVIEAERNAPELAVTTKFAHQNDNVFDAQATIEATLSQIRKCGTSERRENFYWK